MNEKQIKGDELISKAREIIQELIDTGARSWSLHIPARINEDPDLILSRVVADFESERTLRIEAENKLHELQDAVALRTQRQVSMGNNSNDYQIKYSLIFPKQGLMDEILISNIQESRKRREKE